MMGRARAAADEHHLVDVPARQLGVVEGTLHAVHGAVEERANQILVLHSAQFHVEMQGLAVLLGEELLLEPGERMFRKVSLGRLDGTENACLGDEIGTQVNAMLVEKAIADEVHEQVVEIVTAQVCVAVAGKDLDDALLRLDDRDVERAAA